MRKTTHATAAAFANKNPSPGDGRGRHRAAGGEGNKGRASGLMGNALILLLALTTASFAHEARTANAEASPVRIAQGETKVDFNIPKLSLADALAAWSKQTGLQVLRRDTDGATELTTRSVTGKFSPAEALEKMLAATGLTYEFVNDRTVRIAPLRTNAQTTSYSQDGKEITGMTLAQNTSEARNTGPEGSQEKSSEASTEAKESLEEIVVTGTHIRGAAPVGSPLITLDREAIERSGAATVDQFLRKVPQNFGNIDPASANTLRFGPTGGEANQNTGLGATPNIHGIGLGATLTLVDGRRLSPGGITGSVVDVSVIPLAAIERVEVLADGASAIYGADAVAGVVNIILRQDFEGLQSTARYGDTTEGGGSQLDFGQLAGMNWSRGNALASYSFSRRNELSADQRDFVTTVPGGAQSQFTISPRQRTHSALVSLRQEFGPNIDWRLSGNVFDRRSEYTDAFGAEIEHNDVDQFDYGLGSTLTFRLASDWQLDVEGQFYRSKLDFAGTRSFGDFISDSHTRLLSGDLRIQGEIFELPAGSVRAVAGGTIRSETYEMKDNFGSDFDDEKRDVKSLYGEIVLPLLGGADESFPDRLTVSIAGRYDHYGSFGSTTNPKYGLNWNVFPGLKLRGSYGTSFRPPTLFQAIDAPEFVYVLLLADSTTGGETIALARDAGTNPNLKPEQSESFSAGFDIEPRSVPGLTLSLTYFDISYADRIAAPPSPEGVFGFLAEPQLADLVDRSPDPAAVQALMDAAVAAGTYNDFSGPDFSDGQRTAADIQAVFYAGLQNIALTEASGLDAVGRYSFAAAGGRVDLSVGASYLFEMKQASTPSSLVNDSSGDAFGPPDLRVRLGASWEKELFAGSIYLNHTSPFDNPYTAPLSAIDSYQTVDLQLRYDLANRDDLSLLKGTRLTLDIANLLDEDPPTVLNPTNPFDLGFDPSNASAQGRFIALQVTRSW